MTGLTRKEFYRRFDDCISKLDGLVGHILAPSSLVIVETNLDTEFQSLIQLFDDITMDGNLSVDLFRLRGPFERLLSAKASSSQAKSSSLTRGQTWAWRQLTRLVDWIPSLAIDDRIVAFFVNDNNIQGELLAVLLEYLAKAHSQAIPSSTIRRLAQRVLEILESPSQDSTDGTVNKKQQAQTTISPSATAHSDLMTASLRWCIALEIHHHWSAILPASQKERLFLAIWRTRTILPVDLVLAALSAIVLGNQPATIMAGPLALLMKLVAILINSSQIALAQTARAIARQIDLLIRPRRIHPPCITNNTNNDGDGAVGMEVEPMEQKNLERHHFSTVQTISTPQFLSPTLQSTPNVNVADVPQPTVPSSYFHASTGQSSTNVESSQKSRMTQDKTIAEIPLTMESLLEPLPDEKDVKPLPDFIDEMSDG